MVTKMLSYLLITITIAGIAFPTIDARSCQYWCRKKSGGSYCCSFDSSDPVTSRGGYDMLKPSSRKGFLVPSWWREHLPAPLYRPSPEWPRPSTPLYRPSQEWPRPSSYDEKDMSEAEERASCQYYCISKTGEHYCCSFDSSDPVSSRGYEKTIPEKEEGMTPAEMLTSVPEGKMGNSRTTTRPPRRHIFAPPDRNKPQGVVDGFLNLFQG